MKVLRLFRRKHFLVPLLLMLAAPAAAQPQQIIRDGQGRISGTVTTDANGQQTFRDGRGRMTGTSNTDANGTTTIRDAQGRRTGTIDRR